MPMRKTLQSSRRAIASETLGLALAGVLCISATESVAGPASTQAQFKPAKTHFCCASGKRSKLLDKRSIKPSGQPLIGAETFTFKTTPNRTSGSSGDGPSQGFRWWYDYSGGR